MALSRRLIFLVACLTAVLAAQPVVFEGGAVNVANFVPAPFPNYGIAQGSLFTVFGEEMGPDDIVFVPGFPVPTDLAGSSIQVTVGNTTVDCLMVFTVAGRLAAILPSNTPVGDGTLTVIYNGAMSNSIAIRVVEHDPGIFTISQNGLGPVVVTDPFNFVPNTVVNSFAPGDPAVLWVTGLGARGQDATPQVQDLQGPLDLTLRIGSKVITNFIYAGPAPTNAGLDQVNFFIPEDAEEGCAVSVVLQIGDAVSNFATMSISSGDAVCDDDPLALTRAEIQEQQADGTLRVALAAFDTNLTNTAVIGANTIDTPGAHDGRVETITGMLFDAQFNVANPLIGIAPGSCSVVDQLYTNPAPPSATTSLPSPLEPSMMVAGPVGMPITLPANLFVADNNTPQSTNDLTFIQGQEWEANFAVANPQLMQADEAMVSHVLRVNPEDFAAWNPAGAEAQFMGVLRGTTTPQDLTIGDLPTSGDHLVNGTFTIQNPSWRTTITCTTQGDQPFTIPSYVFHSTECGPQSPCNGSATLNIIPNGPATAGMTLGPDNSIGKVNGFDRVLIFFSFSLPAALDSTD